MNDESAPKGAHETPAKVSASSVPPARPIGVLARRSESDAQANCAVPNAIGWAFAHRVQLVDYRKSGDRAAGHDAIHALRVTMHRLVDEMVAEAWMAWPGWSS